MKRSWNHISEIATGDLNNFNYLCFLSLPSNTLCHDPNENSINILYIRKSNIGGNVSAWALTNSRALKIYSAIGKIPKRYLVTIIARISYLW